MTTYPRIDVKSQKKKKNQSLQKREKFLPLELKNPDGSPSHT